MSERAEAGRELDALIATKVMGWRQIRHAHPTYGGDAWDSDWFDAGVPDPDPSGYWPGFIPADYPSARAKHRDWKPSADILSAWRVVEKMERESRIVRLTFNPLAKWTCEIFPPWNERIVSFPHGGKVHRTSYYSTADTAALAICRAALFAIESQNSEAPPVDSIPTLSGGGA